MAELDLTNIVNTSIATPASGVTAVFADTDKKLKIKNDAGTVQTLMNMSSQTIATAAGTTTLTNTSPIVNQFTGVTTQTVKLPDATTIQAGQEYEIRNNSTGLVTVQDGNAGALVVLSANGTAYFSLITAGTVAGVWDTDPIGFYFDVTDPTKKLVFQSSGATTGTILTLADTQSTSQTLSFPNITGSDTLVTLGLAQTITAVKTMTGLNVILVATAGLTIRNPGDTFKYTITSAAIVADRILNLPLTTATDTLMVLGLAQTVTGILTLTTPVLGAATGTSLAMSSFIRTTATTTSGQGIGYTAGGQVTQATSKVTAFSLSRYTGTIQFAADALAADTSSAGATWTNTSIAATDHVTFTHESGGTFGAYIVTCTPAAGSANIKIRNITPGSLSEAPVFRFTVHTSSNA